MVDPSHQRSCRTKELSEVIILVEQQLHRLLLHPWRHGPLSLVNNNQQRNRQGQHHHRYNPNGGPRR